MRELIKKQIRTHFNLIKEGALDISDEELIELIKNYKGNKSIILDFKDRLNFTGKQLTDKQKEIAREIFINERLSHTIKPILSPNNQFGQRVIEKGIETYLGLIKTSKKYLFGEKVETNIKITHPSENWFTRNKKDLEELTEKLSTESLNKEVRFTDGTVMSIESKIEEIYDSLTTDPENYIGFIENGDWSILNKIDTNYSNWFKILGELDANNQLKGQNVSEKIELFFKQRPLTDILSPEKIRNVNIIEKKYDVQIPTLSQADYEILREFNKDFVNIKEQLKKTSEQGSQVESNVRGLLKLAGSIKNNDLIDFSSPGNRVDQIFGIDMLVNMYVPIHKSDKYWVPIQVKSDNKTANTSFLLKSDIEGICVFPTSNPQIEGNWAYITVKNGTEFSFEKLLRYNKCRQKENMEFCEKTFTKELNP